ncbi:unnamed protein product [Leuciscus chuanchicus]
MGGAMLRYVRGGAQGQEEDTDDEQEQPCTSSSGTHQPQPASRGSSQCLYEPDNGNFLKEVELLASFDPVMENYLTKITMKAPERIILDSRHKMN